MERGGARRLTREFKLAALAQMAAGENVSTLGRELAQKERGQEGKGSGQIRRATGRSERALRSIVVVFVPHTRLST
jgi:hypothetical protein